MITRRKTSAASTDGSYARGGQRIDLSGAAGRGYGASTTVGTREWAPELVDALRERQQTLDRIYEWEDTERDRAYQTYLDAGGTPSTPDPPDGWDDWDAHVPDPDAPTTEHENRLDEIVSRVAWERNQADRLCRLDTGETRRLDDMSVLLANDAEPDLWAPEGPTMRMADEIRAGLDRSLSVPDRVRAGDRVLPMASLSGSERRAYMEGQRTRIADGPQFIWYENPEFQARYPSRRERMTFDAGVKAASIAEHRAESGFYEGGELLVMVDDSEGGRTARRVPVPENVGADGWRSGKPSDPSDDPTFLRGGSQGSQPTVRYRDEGIVDEYRVPTARPGVKQGRSLFANDGRRTAR